MEKETLIKFCRFYKGEKECPFEDKNYRNLWVLELFWVDNYDKKKNLLFNCLDEYLYYGLGNFSNTDGTPIMLKAFLFRRYCMERIDIKGFKKWYIESYHTK